MKAEKNDSMSTHPIFMAGVSYFFGALILITITNAGVLAINPVLVSNDSQVYINSTTDVGGKDYQVHEQPQSRNGIPDSFFCGPIIGSHYMFGSASTYCGGFAVTDCSAQCFYRNFTYFQCEGFVCHCFSR